jgi:hypothetical protein
VKRGTPDHPKTGGLAAALGIRKYAAVGLLEMLWHWTSRYAPQGDIGRHSDGVISHALHWDGDPSALIAALTDNGWLDRHDRHRLLVHDWHDHAEDSVKKHLARSGKPFLTKSHAGTLPRRPSVYFLQAERTRAIKIGFTEGPVPTRIAALQTGSAERLILLGAIPGTRKTEQDLHKRLLPHCINNEWFRPDAAVLDLINEQLTKPRRGRRRPTTADNGSLPEPLPKPEPSPSDKQAEATAAETVEAWRAKDGRTIPQLAEAVIAFAKGLPDLSRVEAVREFCAREGAPEAMREILVGAIDRALALGSGYDDFGAPGAHEALIDEGEPMVAVIVARTRLDASEVVSEASEYHGHRYIALRKIPANRHTRLVHTVNALREWVRKLDGKVAPSARASPSQKQSVGDRTMDTLNRVIARRQGDAEATEGRGEGSQIRIGPGEVGGSLPSGS